ncbi:MAG: YbaN family protein [Candidatus Hatepunaea meridiana]|nr:YbaN family protein [Candidatus Hatepunaea meridiana]
MKKLALIIVGTIFLALGIIGILLPLLPTTPFLLLAVTCYAKSSKRLYDWLLNNKWFGNYIKNIREGKGIPLRVKISVILLLWITIGYSAIFIVHVFLIRMILILIAVGVTAHILFIRTSKRL